MDGLRLSGATNSNCNRGGNCAVHYRYGAAQNHSFASFAGSEICKHNASSLSCACQQFEVEEDCCGQSSSSKSAGVLAIGWLHAVRATIGPDAKPLSQNIKVLEDSGNVASLNEIEWDNDGYREIEFRRPDGSRVKVKIDPVSAQPRQ